MKKYIFILMLGALLAVGCQKEDENGDLGGFWKLQQIIHSNGDIEITKEKNLFWSFQLKLIQIRVSADYEPLGRFQHTGDSLFIQMIDTRPNALQIYGIEDATDMRFAVKHLDRNGMILQSETVELKFRKF